MGKTPRGWGRTAPRQQHGAELAHGWASTQLLSNGQAHSWGAAPPPPPRSLHLNSVHTAQALAILDSNTSCAFQFSIFLYLLSIIKTALSGAHKTWEQTTPAWPCSVRSTMCFPEDRTRLCSIWLSKAHQPSLPETSRILVRKRSCTHPSRDL